MKNILRILKKSVLSLESSSTSYTLWLTSFTSLIFARLMVENWINGFKSYSSQFIFYEFTHTFFFFLLSFLVLWPLVAFFGKTSLIKSSTILLFGFIVILTPPLLDVWIAQGAHLWSFYKFDSLFGLWHRYFTLFGDRPDIGITYGVRIEVVVTSLLLGIYAYLKTSRFIRAVVAMISTYSVLFILGTFPSWITFIVLGFQNNILAINDIDIAQFFLSPLTLFSRSNFELIGILNIKMSLLYAPLTLFITAFYLWRYFPKKFFALIHNARIPQIIYHEGLVFIGAGIALAFAQASLTINFFNTLGFINLLIAVGCAWMASVITNDLFDQNIDVLTNTNRPLPQKIFSQEEYRAIGITFFMASIILSALVSFKIMSLIIIYQALAWIYSAQPLRLKRFPLIATFIAAIASLLILLSGFLLIAPNGTISEFPASLLIFFMIIFMTSLPLKDFKDILGDKADGVYTIPVLFGEQWGKISIGIGIFASYLSSVFVFHEPKLFWWALLGGSASFWILMLSETNESSLLSYRKLPGWLLGVIALYVSIFIAIIHY